jgi:putative inorganic carbon (HCO3(-)) transporter
VTFAPGWGPALASKQPARPALNRLLVDTKSIVAVLVLGLVAVVLATAPVTSLVILLAAAAAVLAILLQPALGLVLLALAIPFGSLFSSPLSSVGVVDALVALTLAAWLLRGLAARSVTIRRTPLLWPLALFLWFGALSLLMAASWQQGVLEWLKWAEFAALYLVAAQIFHRRFIIWVLVALFGTAVVEVVVGAFQFVRNVGPEAFAISGQFTRAYGTLQQPNPYAGYLGYLMPVALSLAIGLLIHWRHSGKMRWLLLSIACFSLALALLAGIGLSWSRGAWLGAAVSIAAVIAFRSRRGMLITACVVLGVCAVVLLIGAAGLPGPIAGRLADLSSYVMAPDPATTEITDQNFSVLERLAHWQAGIRMFNSAPWLGIGIGNYGTAYARFALPHWYAPLGHAHNIYINFLAEMGLLGASTFGLLWAGALIVGFRASRAGEWFLKALALGLLGTLAYLTVHNLFDNLFVQHLQLVLALLLAAVVALMSDTLRPAL